MPSLDLIRSLVWSAQRQRSSSADRGGSVISRIPLKRNGSQNVTGVTKCDTFHFLGTTTFCSRINTLCEYLLTTQCSYSTHNISRYWCAAVGKSVEVVSAGLGFGGTFSVDSLILPCICQRFNFLLSRLRFLLSGLSLYIINTYYTSDNMTTVTTTTIVLCGGDFSCFEKREKHLYTYGGLRLEKTLSLLSPHLSLYTVITYVTTLVTTPKTLCCHGVVSI